MSMRPPLWMQSGSGLPQYDAVDDRALITTALVPGVQGAGDLAVTPATGLAVSVAPGTCVVAGTASGQGNYLCRSTAVQTISLAGSPPSGQSRIDLIVAQVRDQQYAGSNSDWVLTNVTGTASTGTPVVPATPANALVLARILVAGASASIPAGNITDMRRTSGAKQVGGAMRAGSWPAWCNNAKGGWLTITGGSGYQLHITGLRGPHTILASWAGQYHPIANVQTMMEAWIGIDPTGTWATGNVQTGGNVRQYVPNFLAVGSLATNFGTSATITADLIIAVGYGTGNTAIWCEGWLNVLVIPQA